MQIVKTTNNKIQFLVLGKLILSLNNTASLQITSNEKGILITDITLKKIELFTNEIESTQLLPAAAVPFSGSTQSLFELLDASFFFNVSGGSGEVNDGLNVGAGNGIFKQKSGLNLEFKTLIGGSGLSIVNNANDLTISATGGGGDMLKATYDPTNVGADVYDYANALGITQVTAAIVRINVTANEDNYNPAGFGTTNLLELNPTGSDRDITGFVAPAVGVARIITIVNLSSSLKIKFKNNDSSSLAANRILLRDNGDKDLKKQDGCRFYYDHTGNRWRVFGAGVH